MEGINELLEKFNKIDFLSDAELEKLDFYELGLYYEFLNNLENEYDKLTPNAIKEG